MSLLLTLVLSLGDGNPREVLCLFDSTENRTPRICESHLYAETALNYLGLIAEYRDVNEPLPSDEEMARYRGILTWFVDNRMRRPREYWAWIARQPALGRKVVILGNLGATYDVPRELVNEGLRPLGLAYHGRETENLTVVEILKKDPLVEFERTLDRELKWYVHLTSTDPRNRVYLRARRTDVPDSESDLVVTGPNGGLAWITIHFDPAVDRDQWRLNPFAFLAKAFGLESEPRMDLTTSMGRRIFFASIDGDGIANQVKSGPNAGRFSGEVVRDGFLKAIDLPATASVIAADLDAHGDLARSILGLPNVEVGAHGWYHPISWSKKTLAYPGSDFSLDREVNLAVKRVQEACGKPVKIYLWTGDCDPPDEAVAMVDALGIANLNGSDPGRYQNYESLANLRPATLRRGRRLQFNARSMSENHFTDLWTRNFFGYRNALSSYERTGGPLRINPIHVYFHFYVVEQPAGEAALREIYDWVQKQDIFPMTASEYVDWARGFYSARIERGPGRSWRIRGYGACRTVRFDDTDESVDLKRSSGVLGFRREGRTLYVHLAPAEEAVVALGTEPPAGTWLIESNGDWRNGKIHARTAARATFMTPRGPVTVSAPGHTADAPQ